MPHVNHQPLPLIPIPDEARRKTEQLQEIVIRAHYLSMELRDICAATSFAPPEMSLAAGAMLKNWALAFGRAVEAAEAGRLP
jgi:hypothetical protein